jgi:hypothetical protein
MSYAHNAVGSWFGEAAGTMTPNLAAARSSFDVWSDGKSFAERFEELFENYRTQSGLDIKRDLGPMVSDRAFMEQYKTDLLTPIFEGFRAMSPEDPHIESHVENVNRLWDAKVRQYSESASTTAFLPIATLEFPVLTKQFFSSITKDIIEVETVKTPNISKHIKTTYLVDNATGDMYEYPKCIFEGTWEKVWDAAKGIAFDENVPIDITGGAGWNINLIAFAQKGAAGLGDAVDGPGPGADGKVNFNAKLSYNLRIVAIDYDGNDRIPILGNGITIELSTGGTLVNGDIKFKGKAADGTVVEVEDLLSGKVNFQQGTLSISSATGKTEAIYVAGYLSNEDNVNTVSVREVRSIQKFMIEDGPRWNMPFSIEEIEDAAALLDMNYYNRMVDEIVRTQEMIEGQSVLRFFDDEFRKYAGVDFDIYNLESIVQRSYVDLDVGSLIIDPFKYMANAVQFAIKSMIHKLTDAAKLDKLSFVIIGNPMATQLMAEWTGWKMEQGASIGGIQVNNSYGFATDMGASVRIVASNQIQAYTKNPVTAAFLGLPALPAGYNAARELVLRIIAYPTDPEHISFRHLKYTSHLLATPAQSAYTNVNTSMTGGGAYNVVTATSRYKDIAIQGLQCELILLNSARIYGVKA